MQPARPSLSDAVRITDRLKNRPMRNGAARLPAAAPSRRNRNADSSRPRGAGGLYCANTVGAFGVVSAGQNWDRLAIAARRWELNSVGAKEVSILLLPDAHFSRRVVRSLGGFFDNNISPNGSTIPIQRGKVIDGKRISTAMIPIMRRCRKMRNFRSKTSLRSRKITITF